MTSSYKELNRRKKISRFVAHFRDQVISSGAADPETSPEVAAVVVQRLQLAPAEQWAQLAKAMHERTKPSVEAQRQVIQHFASVAGALVVDPEAEHNRMDGRPQAVDSGTLADGAAYRTTAVGLLDRDHDLDGWSWWIHVEDGRKADGYTRCPAPQLVFALAKEQVAALSIVLARAVGP